MAESEKCSIYTSSYFSF